MRPHLTRKGQRMFSRKEDDIPIHWFALSGKQKKILEALHSKKELNSCWDETALQLLIDIKMVRYD